MIISLEGTWNVILSDGAAGQMFLRGTLDENGIGHKDAGANQWHPDAELGNALGEVDADAPIATRFTRKHTFEGEARLREPQLFMQRHIEKMMCWCQTYVLISKKYGMLNTTEDAPTMCWCSAPQKVLIRYSYTMCWPMTLFSTMRQQHPKAQKCRVVTKARSWSTAYPL